MSDQPIIDPHVHLWSQRTTPRQTSPLVKLFGWHRGTLHWMARRMFPRAALEFFGAPDHLLADYLPADYAADTAGREVRGFVHVEAAWAGKGPMAPVDETRWLESLAEPRLLAIVGAADLSRGDDAGEVIAAHVEASARVRGIRHTLTHHPARQILHGEDRAELSRTDAWRRGYACLARHGLGLAMPCLGWQYHRGEPPPAERVAGDFAPLIRFAIDAFGADRCMLGSNFPIDKVSLSWATLYDAFDRIVADRSDADRRALFHDTAARVYRVDG